MKREEDPGEFLSLQEKNFVRMRTVLDRRWAKTMKFACAAWFGEEGQFGGALRVWVSNSHQ